MTEPKDAQATADLIAQTLDSVRAAHDDLTELAARQGGISSLVQTARGTALIHDLRKSIDELNRLLPFKG